MNTDWGRRTKTKSKPLHPMRENREFYSCNVRYVQIVNFILVMYDMYFHFMFAIFLFSGAKLRKKEIERNLYISHFLIILTI